MKYNMKDIMTKAWKLVKKFGYTMSKALKTAWANAKTIRKAFQDSLISEECHTWSGWQLFNKEVRHESKCLFQVTVIDPSTKKGTKVLSYFGASQVVPLGSQD